MPREVHHRLTRRAFCAAITFAGLPLGSDARARAESLELLMFERLGCPWCRRWDEEIGAVYPHSPEGQRAPLRRVNLDQRNASVPGLSEPVFYSPTFVLLKNGREIGRITGYMHAEGFWGLLEKLLRNADLQRADRAIERGGNPVSFRFAKVQACS
jgi:hypothetical protein